MYVNPHFAERDLAVLHEAIEDARFGVLVLCAAGPMAAHVPFVLKRECGACGTLQAHVAKRDPIARHIGTGEEALAIFSGPRAYVSPRSLPERGLPTYNYVAVHARGRPNVLEGAEAVTQHLGELAAVHERGREKPWSIDEADPGQIERLLEHIVAFELPIESIQGKRKLSQNRSATNRAGVIAGLRADGREQPAAVADLMAGYVYGSDAEQSLVSGL